MKLVCREIVEIYIVEWLEKSKEAATGPKRKGKGFGRSKRKGKLDENTPLAEAIIDGEKPSTSHEEPDVSDSESAQPLSSSAK